MTLEPAKHKGESGSLYNEKNMEHKQKDIAEQLKNLLDPGWNSYIENVNRNMLPVPDCHTRTQEGQPDGKKTGDFLRGKQGFVQDVPEENLQKANDYHKDKNEYHCIIYEPFKSPHLGLHSQSTPQ